MCQAVLRVDLLNEAALMEIAIICVPVLAEFLMKESKEQVRLLFKCLPTYPYGHKFNLWHCPFDSTKGHPGEGWRHAGKRKTRRELLRRKKRKDRWSKQFPNLKIATWNTRSLTVERFDYCKRLKYDALGLTELWRTQEKFLEANNLWTCRYYSPHAVSLGAFRKHSLYCMLNSLAEFVIQQLSGVVLYIKI